MRKGLIVLLVIFTTGCNVVARKAYDGPSRSSSELAVLKGGASGDELSRSSLVDFRAVDGVRQPQSSYLLSILPGRRAVALTETLRMGRGTRTQYCAIQIDALAGCTYVPRPPSPPSDALSGATPNWEWSVDMPVTAECPAGGDYSVRVPARCGSSDKILEGPTR
jgi:hypothetical protein